MLAENICSFDFLIFLLKMKYCNRWRGTVINSIKLSEALRLKITRKKMTIKIKSKLNWESQLDIWFFIWSNSPKRDNTSPTLVLSTSVFLRLNSFSKKWWLTSDIWVLFIQALKIELSVDKEQSIKAAVIKTVRITIRVALPSETRTLSIIAIKDNGTDSEII